MDLPIAGFPFYRYRVPGSTKLSCQLLNNAYESIESIEESIRRLLASAAKIGSTMSPDGWSDVRRRPVLNFMNVTRGNEVFLKSIDCTEHMAEGRMLLASLLKR